MIYGLFYVLAFAFCFNDIAFPLLYGRKVLIVKLFLSVGRVHVVGQQELWDRINGQNPHEEGALAAGGSHGGSEKPAKELPEDSSVVRFCSVEEPVFLYVNMFFVLFKGWSPKLGCEHFFFSGTSFLRHAVRSAWCVQLRSEAIFLNPFLFRE